MKIKSNTLYILLYILLFFLHFAIWEIWVKEQQVVFVKYYLFLSFLFMLVLTILSIIYRIYPQYVGFAFMGVVLFKLTVMILIMKKLQLSTVPMYKLHFIPPYLISLALITGFAIGLIKHDKK